MTVDSTQPHFQLCHTSLDEETELIIVVKDQAGRKLPTKGGNSTSYSGGPWLRTVQFEPLPETTEVQLEVIVNRGRTFEFLVAPRKPDAKKVSP